MKMHVRCHSLLVVLAAAVFVSPTHGQLQVLVDSNSGVNTGQSAASQFTQLGSLTLFAATSGDEGRELWKSDGTTAGTVLVKDINPGSSGSNPIFLAVVGSTLYFAANNGTIGSELWKTDGTTAGTVLVKDIFPGTGDGCGTVGVAMGSTLIFRAQSTDGNVELWKSDGTDAGTVLVRDIRSSTVNPGSAPNRLTAVSPSMVFFTAITDTAGEELWKTDGSFDGTVLVKDINAGSSGSTIQGITLLGSTTFFGARDSAGGYELWKSDGTTAGTLRVKDILPGTTSGVGISDDRIAAMGGHVYFPGNSSTNNAELFRSDGTEAGTVLVKEINPSFVQFTGSSSPSNFLVVGSTLYFAADNGSAGIELWKSDGTDAGTVLVKDIDPGKDFGLRFTDNGTSPIQIRNVGSTIYGHTRKRVS